MDQAVAFLIELVRNKGAKFVTGSTEGGLWKQEAALRRK